MTAAQLMYDRDTAESLSPTNHPPTMHNMNRHSWAVRLWILIGSLASLAGLGSPTAWGEEVTLRAVSAFAEGTRFSKNFERFLKKINQEGKGLVRVTYIGGGGKVMSPFEMGNAVQSGVVDMANLASAYYTNLMPEADAFKLVEHPTAELRQHEAWAYIEQLHNEKLNAHYLARQGEGIPFHLYLVGPIDKPDLTGLKLRVTPIYHAFFKALDAIPLRMPPGEVYTGLQWGVVDGYGWPAQGVLDLGWHEMTKYRVDPGFYQVDISILVNLEVWRGLNAAQQRFLTQQALWLESLNAENAQINGAEVQRQAEAGIQAITFSDADSEQFLRLAHDAGWARVMQVNPEQGPRLKKLFTR